ncbi:hypothetical protein DPMN_132635 [Dreissena polymorpha]|uniref:Uncharacterized protein n=1 Tax=Dreissena polymorpha TaxID=45954 RepID=A0A9D4J928_DREPO|nr:hypothetical protein DPMN_132635 [Dreissena polymorpha]
MWPLEKNAPPLGSHVFQANVFIFIISQDIIKFNLLTKFHEDWTINVASRVLTRNNAPPSERIQDIIGTNLLTKFHEDWKINMASRVLTWKNAPPPGGHVFQPTGIILKLIQDIIGMNLSIKSTTIYSHKRKNAPPLGSQYIIVTNLLIKFHEDWTINVASRVLTRQMLTAHDARHMTHDGQKAITKAHHEHIVLR